MVWLTGLPLTNIHVHVRTLIHILSPIHQCMHTYASISIIHFLVHYQLTSNMILSFKNANAHMFHCAPLSPPFCNPYRLHCNPNVFLLIMSVLHSLFPARIDWSCPMHPALYLYSHNPQAQRAKIIVQTQRTHKSHIHCVLEKSFKMDASVGVKSQLTKQGDAIQTFLFF